MPFLESSVARLKYHIYLDFWKLNFIFEFYLTYLSVPNLICWSLKWRPWRCCWVWENFLLTWWWRYCFVCLDCHSEAPLTDLGLWDSCYVSESEPAELMFWFCQCVVFTKQHLLCFISLFNRDWLFINYNLLMNFYVLIYF